MGEGGGIRFFVSASSAVRMKYALRVVERQLCHESYRPRTISDYLAVRLV